MSDAARLTDGVRLASAGTWRTTTGVVSMSAGARGSVRSTGLRPEPSMPEVAVHQTTYDELFEFTKRLIVGDSAYAYLPALRKFCEIIGDDLTDPVDRRIREWDEPGVFMAFLQGGFAEKTAGSNRSLLKLVNGALLVLELSRGRDLDYPEKLRLLLEARRISQRELAKKVGVSEGTVRRWLHGDGWRSLEPERIYLIEKVLTVPASTLGGAKRTRSDSRQRVACVEDRPEGRGFNTSPDEGHPPHGEKVAHRGRRTEVASLPARGLAYRLPYEQWPALFKEEWRCLEEYKRPSVTAMFEGENDGGWRTQGSVDFYTSRSPLQGSCSSLVTRVAWV